ncbi:MAG: DUF3343 domain-containing protein [Christensenellaceae bacterium]|jgi:hypothetical protein|nr:DUF3343 domain-containing protein [Christensenellaceae bacterium]
MYIIAAFRSRNQTLLFANILSSYGVKTVLINTPGAVMVSCGISVRFDYTYLVQAKEVLNRRKFDTFAGFFMVSGFGTSMTVRRVV